MKRKVVLLAIGTLVLTSAAQAQNCANGQRVKNVAEFNTLFTNQRVCVISPNQTVAGRNDIFQQTMLGSNTGTSGTLRDYFRRSDPFDPQRDVGTWRVVDNPGNNAVTLTFAYTNGGTFSYRVYSPSANVVELCTNTANPTLVLTGRASSGPYTTAFPTACPS